MSSNINIANHHSHRWPVTVLPVALFVLLSAISFFIAYQVSEQEQDKRSAQFTTTSIQTAHLIQEKVNHFPQLLKATRGMVINQSYSPSTKNWRLFFNSMNLDYRELGIIGITFTEYVERRERQSFLTGKRAIYGAQFDIFPQSERNENFVVMQASPDNVAKKIRGYDIASEVRRYEAAQYAKNSGQIALSSPISLLPTDQYSLDYLMLAPVYANSEQPDSGLFLDTDMAFSGWITIGFSLSMLIDHSIANLNEPLRIQLHDPRSASGTVNFDSETGDISPLQQQFQQHFTLDISDEPIALVIMPSATQAAALATPRYNYEVLVISLVTSLLAALSLRLILNARRRALGLAERMVERSRETNVRYQALFEQSPEAIIIHIQRGVVLCNESAVRLLGASAASELIGRDILDLVHPESRPLVEQRLETIGNQSLLKPIEQRIMRLDGSSFLAEVSSSQITYDSQPGIQVMFRDITAAKESLNQARIAQRVLEHTRESIMVTDVSGSIIMTNPAFTELTGYQRDEALHKTPSLLSSGHHDSPFFGHLWQHLINTGNWAGEIVNRRKNGEIYIQQTNISAAYDKYGDISHFVCLMGDITEQKKKLDSIRFQAMHDDLTRLANRPHFEARAEEALRRAQSHNKQLAVMFIDLDGFKRINDNWGHTIGDKLLITVAERLNDLLPTGSTLARIGGDEFLILTEGLSQYQQAERIGCQILDSLSATIEIDDLELHISASLGIALFPSHGNNIRSLIDRADKAMYQAKRQGKNRLYISQPTQPTTQT